MLADELKALLDRSLRANAQVISRVGGVLGEAVQAAKDPQRRTPQSARGLLGDLVKAELDYLKDLSRSGAQYLDAVSALAESTVPSRDSDVTARAEPAAAPAAPPTSLSGRRGETVAFQFKVDNPNPQPVPAEIEARDWLAQDGARVAADGIALQPADAEIPAQGATTVTGRIAIDDRFTAGQAYDTVIRVAGFPGREVALRLLVVE